MPVIGKKVSWAPFFHFEVFLFGCLFGFLFFFSYFKVLWLRILYLFSEAVLHASSATVLKSPALLICFQHHSWSLVEPHLVKSLRLSQVFCHHLKVFPSSCTWYFFSIPLRILMTEMCFCKLFLFKALVRPRPLKSKHFWWLLSAQKGKDNLSSLGFRYLSTWPSSQHKQQPCRTFGSSVSCRPSHWSCTISLFWPTNWCGLFFLICMRPPDHWRLCDGGMLGTFSLAAQAKEKPRAWSERL